MMTTQWGGLKAVLVLALGVSVFSACSEQDPAPPTCETKVLHGLNFEPHNDSSMEPGELVTTLELTRRMELVASCTQWVRGFGVDAGLEKIGQVAHDAGLQAAMQAYISDDTVENDRQITILTGLAEAGQADMLIVGSFVIDGGALSNVVAPDESEVDRLITYINTVKAADHDLPVGTVEPLEVYEQHPVLVDAVDVVLVSYFPFYEGKSIVEASGDFDAWYLSAQAVAGAKPLVIAETGWPSGGNSVGLAEPGLENAATYLNAFAAWAAENNVDYFYTEAFDQPWKGENLNDSQFGIWDSALMLKPGMEAVIQ